MSISRASIQKGRLKDCSRPVTIQTYMLEVKEHFELVPEPHSTRLDLREDRLTIQGAFIEIVSILLVPINRARYRRAGTPCLF